MADEIDVLIAFPLDPELIEAVRAVSPRLRVRELSPAACQVALARAETTPELAQELASCCAQAEVLFGPATMDPALLRSASRLRWMQLLSAGADRMLDNGLVGGSFTVTNLSGLHATVIAEYVLGTMLMLSKGLHHAVREQQRHQWNFRWMPEMRGSTVGIVGMGAIGAEVARLSQAFGLRVLGLRRSPAPREGDRFADKLYPLSALHELLAESDYVVLAMPLTPQTRHMIGERELAAMKPTACLVNIARGAVVEEEALYKALSEGRIAGAALDVFEKEPLPPDSPFWDLENVIITPHISGAVTEYGHRATEIFLRNLERYVKGEPLLNVVEAERGY